MSKQTRRTAIKTIGAACASFTIPFPAFANLSRLTQPLKFGVVADLHGGLAADAEWRLDAFIDAMKSETCDALIQLGDFAYPNKDHQTFADRFNAAHDATLHVIGNHEFDHGLKREDCYKAWGIESGYYRKDVGELRTLVLDGNEEGSPTHDGGYHSFISDKQKNWLADELQRAEKPVLILSHQPLAGVWAVDNAIDIQELLSRHQAKIILCLNGHSHVDSLVLVGGVAYLHVNSASYFWVGGEARTAFYTDPLFTTITIDPSTETVTVAGKSSTWKEKTPKQLGYFEREDAPPEANVTPRIRSHHISKTSLKVMTWNIWGGLNQDPRYTIVDQTARQRMIDIIRESGADVIAMIETYGSAADIARALGFHHHTPAGDANLCIFSRYPLSDVDPLDGLNPFSFIAATVTLPGGQRVRVYDIWLTSGGRHIVEITNRNVSDQAFTEDDDLRFDHLNEFLEHNDFQEHMANADNVPVIVAGDFNCVSHLDHTEATRQAGLNHTRVLPIKVSKAMQEAGFTDSYRAANPEITEETLGHTWTTVGKGFVYEEGNGFVPTANHPRPEYRDRYTRIDYIYARSQRLKAIESNVITHHPSQSGRSFPEFPSDHAAVLTMFELKKR